MAKKLICNLPNASNNINGIAFEPYEYDGMISVDVVDDITVNRFLKIAGYTAIEIDADKTGGKPQTNQPESSSGKKTKADVAKKDEVNSNG